MPKHLSHKILTRYAEKQHSISDVQVAKIDEHLRLCGFCEERERRLRKNEPLPEIGGVDLPTRIGDYRVVEKLGAGGYGKVFRAWDDTSAAWVAIKVFHEEPNGSQKTLPDEVRIAGKIRDCATTAKVLTTLEEPVCIVQEFIGGGSLEDALDRSSESIAEIGLDWQLVVDRMIEVASALMYLHQNDITHCDVKPENILIRKTGEAALADFGSAVDRTTPMSRRVNQSYSPKYTSPEGLRDAKEAGLPISDIFSLGVTLYRLLTNQFPFAGTTANELILEIEDFHVARPVTIKKGISAALDDLCMKMLSPAPADRPQSAEEVYQALIRIKKSNGKRTVSFLTAAMLLVASVLLIVSVSPVIKLLTSLGRINQTPTPEERSEIVSDQDRESTNQGTGNSDQTPASDSMPPEYAGPVVLRPIHDAGHLDTRVTSLPDESLTLSSPQGRLVIAASEDLLEFLEGVEETHRQVWNRWLPVRSVWLKDSLQDRVAEGLFVPPKLRLAATSGLFNEPPPTFDPALQFDLLRDPRRKSRHLLNGIPRKVTGLQIRSSDIFYILATYRSALVSQKEILLKEGEFDELLGMVPFSYLTSQESHTEFTYKGVYGGDITVKSRGHVYLPRLYQKDFKAAHGPYYIEEDPLTKYRPKTEWLPTDFFRQPSEVPPKAFLTLETGPRNRDNVLEMRQRLNSTMQGVAELLSPQWSAFLPEEPGLSLLDGEDTYFRQRMLMEEVDALLGPLVRDRFETRLRVLAHADRDFAISKPFRDYLSTEQAIELREKLNANPELMKLDYSSSDPNSLAEPMGSAFKAIQTETRQDFFQEGVPESMAECIQKLSEGLHYLKADETDLGMELIFDAVSKYELSHPRREMLGRLCVTNMANPERGRRLLNLDK